MIEESKVFSSYLDWDDIDPDRRLPRIKGMPNGESDNWLGKSRALKRPVELDYREQFDDLREYNFTYEASRHESWWLLDSLGPFYDEQWFDDVIRIIKGGKEASVYLCQGNPSAEAKNLAAKVFRPRSLRNLRKDYIYREGRSRLDSDGLVIHDDRQSRAMKRKTEYGQELMHTSWIEHEYRTLQILHKAGCDVPKPYASDHNAILMEYIGDRNTAAPTLSSVSVDKKEAKVLYEHIVNNLEIMLAHGRVHGDLSAYNVLYWGGEITLIDFPQAVNPNKNTNSYPIFQRDVNRICGYLNSQGMNIDSISLAEELWTSHGYNTAPNILWDRVFESEDYDVDRSF